MLSEVDCSSSPVPSWSISLCLAILFLLTAALRVGQGEEPAKLSDSQINQLKFDGDRLADQGDYLNALRKYTKAYLGVVSEIRGQAFTENVEPKMFSREELGKEMLEQMEKEYTAEDLKLMDSSYYVFGLMKPELKSEELVTKLLTEEVAGFYDPDNKRMVLIVEDGPKEEPNWLGKLLGARSAFDKDEQKTTLAHELTHALQDQLYDLNAMQDGIEDDDDMLIAFSALVEGDATLLMFAEAQGGDISDMDPEAMRATFNMMSWMMPLAGGATYREAPPIFRDSLVFPYIQGMLFALSVAGENGWPAVHSSYRHPPLSTEQIMHPSKYLDPKQYDAPVVVSIPDLTDLIGTDWKRLGGNCLGELQTSIMLKKVRGGNRASAGWDGDKYEVYERADGKLGLASVSQWDSGNDAQEFAKAYKLHRAANPFGTDAVFAHPASHKVVVDNANVYILGGFPTEVAEALVDRLRQSTFKEKTFPLPSAEHAEGNGNAANPNADPRPESKSIEVLRDQPFGEHDAQKLDAYFDANIESAPIVLWVHGGGWRLGDKKSVGLKKTAFTKNGYTLVSTNYRLAPEASVEEMAQDIASAVRWSKDNATQIHGDASKIILAGHSAGAHLVALVSTDATYLARENLQLRNVAGCISIDTAAYDVPALIESLATARKRLYTSVFGSSRSTLQALSPVNYVQEAEHRPSFLIMHVADRKDSTLQSNRFAKRLSESGADVSVYAAQEKTHASINRELGAPKDAPTSQVFDFLKRVISSKSLTDAS
ncbi:MAG: alpha/beta hydrolase fold domain-containing protein [Aureliella sp.]